VDAAAIGVMAAWFLASVLGQLPFPRIERMRRWDLCGLVPYWNFFAPHPGTRDFHLLYRDRLADGTVTPWTEVPLCDARRWWHAAWNPVKREKKALFDVTVQLLKEALQTPRTELLQVSVPYLVLLTFVSALPRPAAATGTQFLLMVSPGSVDDPVPEPMFTSALHAL
jgi:hypothetical protein